MKDPILTILVIIALSALSSWIKRKSAPAELDESEAPPVTPRPPRQTPPVRHVFPNPSSPAPAPRPSGSPSNDWEKEIRRLFEMEEPVAPPPRKVPVPTVTVPTPPKRGPAPVIARSSQDYKSQTTFTSAEGNKDPDEGPQNRPSHHFESDAPQSRASQLSERVAQRMHDVDRRTTTHTPSVGAESRTRYHAATPGSAWLRDREKIREAFIASLIFAPPKSLEKAG